MNILTELKSIARTRGLTVLEKGPYHFQICGGPLLVNYYPNSRRRTAYVQGTTAGRHNVTPKQAVEMCFYAPAVVPKSHRDGRSGNKKKRLKLWNAGNRNCYRCGIRIESFEDASLEHKIPLNRGGLNNLANCALSHQLCNHEAGSDMPELKAIERDCDREMFGTDFEYSGLENVGNK